MTGLSSVLMRSVVVASSLILAGVLASCSTAASMRVEVEVYKGPLSVTKEIQEGELFGVISEGITSFQIFLDDACYAYGNYECPMKNGTCLILEGVIEPTHQLLKAISDELNEYNDKTLYHTPKICEEKLLTSTIKRDKLEYSTKETKPKPLTIKTLVKISQYATQFKVKAFFWAESQIAAMHEDPHLRRILTNFTTIAAEFANQVSARAAVLAKQLDGEQAIEGRKLSTSDHLRDASPTEFLYLYDWYNAVLPDSDGGSDLSRADRVRVVQRLFSDHYWTKINDVFASGQGEVRMVLVKDDIGNWNLKSFDSDPTKLLAAYRQLSLASIQLAVDLTKKIGTGGASGVMDLARELAQNRVGSARIAAARATRIDSLRQRVLQELTTLRDNRQQEGMQLITVAGEAKTKADRLKGLADNARTTHRDKVEEIKTREEDLRDVKSRLFELQEELKDVQGELKRVEDRLDALGPPSAGTPQANEKTKLEARQTELKAQKQKIEEEQGTLKSRPGELEQAIATLKSQEGQLRGMKDEAESNLRGAITTQQEAGEALRQFAAETIREARKSLEVHRRVLDALKENQVPVSSQETPIPELPQET